MNVSIITEIYLCPVLALSRLATALLCNTPHNVQIHTITQAFTNEKYEKQRFQDAVRAYQGYSITTQASLSLLNGTQQLIVQGCTVGALILTARRVLFWVYA